MEPGRSSRAVEAVSGLISKLILLLLVWWGLMELILAVKHAL